MVRIPGHLEERHLPGRFFGNEAPDDNEALRSLPANRFVFELCHPNLRKNFLVRKRAEVSPDGFGNPGHNGVGTWDRLDIFGEAVVVERRIGTHPNISDARWQFGEAFLQKRDGVGHRMSIAREIGSFPDIAGFAFEAKERLIRRAASLFGVEPDTGSLLLAIDRDDVGIQVEDHGGKRVGFHEELSSESVVERLKGTQAARAEAFQKSSEGGWIWEGRKIGQILEDPILLQEDVGFDPSQSENDRVENGENGIADRVKVVDLMKPDILRQSGSEFDILEKLLQ